MSEDKESEKFLQEIEEARADAITEGFDIGVKHGRNQAIREIKGMIESYREKIYNLNRNFAWYEMKKDVNAKLKQLISKIEKKKDDLKNEKRKRRIYEFSGNGS